MRRSLGLSILCVTTLALARAAHPATIHVPTDRNTIQGGINAAVPGDSVVVACGIYEELGIVMKSGITLTSATGDFDCVTIQPELYQDDTSHGIVCDALDAGTVIQGFTINGDGLSFAGKRGIVCTSSDVTIRNCWVTWWSSNGPGIDITGGAPLIEGCTIDWNGAESHGGGIRSFDASPTIRNCLVENNSSGLLDGARGGGIWCGGTTSAIIEGCIIRGNRSAASNGPATAYGGGVSCTDQAIVRDCTISENTSEEGGGVDAIGSVTIANCTIDSNSARWGGGVHLAGSPRIEHCTIVGNGGRNGAGVAVTGSGGTILSSRITGNSGEFGGGLYASNASVTVSGCTIVNNHGDTTGGIHSVGSTLDVDNSVFLNECGIVDVRLLSASTLNIGCSNLDSGPRLRVVSSAVNWLGGTFFADPLFCEAVPCGGLSTAGDYRLDPDSPCLPANNACGVQMGALGEGCDIISVDPETWTRIKGRYGKRRNLK
jgi:hypothetical protein